jgi:hypothetical protein
MPKADHVILGQKGAMERNVRTAQKVELIIQQLEKDPNLLASLDKTEQKIIDKKRLTIFHVQARNIRHDI